MLNFHYYLRTNTHIRYRNVDEGCTKAKHTHTQTQARKFDEMFAEVGGVFVGGSVPRAVRYIR